MVVSGVVGYDREATAYSLPPEHAASLTRAAGPGNAAAMATMCPMLGNVERELIEAFKNGGGVPYASFEGFAASMAEMSAMRFDHNLVDAQIPLVPGIVEQLEAGIDRRRHGLRLGPRDQRHGQALAEQPLQRLRLLRGGDRARARRGPRLGARERQLRGTRRLEAGRLRAVRPDHHVRRGPRPGGPRRDAGLREPPAPPRRRHTSAPTSPPRAMSPTTSSTLWVPAFTRSRCSTA